MARIIRSLAFAAVMVLAAASALAQGAAGTGASSPVNVSIDLSSTQFHIGDAMSMTVRTDRDAWVYVFSTDAHGTTRQIFPNGFHRDNHIRGVRSVRLPSGGYSLVAAGPEGSATISAFATTQRFDWLRQYDIVGISGENFPVRLTSPVQFRARLEQSIAESVRAMDVQRQSVPARSAQGGVWPSTVQTSSAWRVYPACGYATRIIHISRRPARPVVSYREAEPGFWRDGTAFYYSSPRGTISQGYSLHYPSSVRSFDPPIYHYPYGHTPGYFSYQSVHPPTYQYSSPYYHSTSPYYHYPSGSVRLSRTTIRSSPSRADVYIDGRHWGQTPVTVRLPPGTYELYVQRHGYDPVCRTLRVREGRSDAVQLNLRRLWR
jgi:hypothetical protein